MPSATILHTNDFHNHLAPAQAEKLKAMRQELGDSGMLLDAGDAISSGNVTYRPAGEPILDLMSGAGYDAMTVGNREFHFTQGGFSAKVCRARFPVLCANVRARDARTPLPVRPWIARTLAGAIRVTVFGLTVPMITERMLVRNVSAFVFDDPLRTAERIVSELRPHCDVVVCLSHIGVSRDRELAERVPGIDLIIGGHTHVTLPEGERVGECLIVQAGWWAHSYGRVIARVDGGAVDLTAEVHAL